jgi:hypothetical protein
VSLAVRMDGVEPPVEKKTDWWQGKFLALEWKKEMNVVRARINDRGWKEILRQKPTDMRGASKKGSGGTPKKGGRWG